MLELTYNTLKNYLSEKISSQNNFINDDIKFTDNIVIDENRNPIVFNGIINSEFEVKFGNNCDVTFHNANIHTLIYSPNNNIRIVDCKIDSLIYSKNTNNNNANGIINIENCTIKEVNLSSNNHKITVTNSNINFFSIQGNSNLNLEIKGINGKKSKIEILKIHVNNTKYQGFRPELIVTNSIIGNKTNPKDSEIKLEGASLNFTNVVFTHSLTIGGKNNSLMMEGEVKFNILQVEGFNEYLHLLRFYAKMLVLRGSFNEVYLNLAIIEKLNLETISELHLLKIEGSEIDNLVISNNNLKSLQITGSEKPTKIGLLRFNLNIVNTYCDSYSHNIEVDCLEFMNCNAAKDSSVKFLNIKIRKLSFNSFNNYGNVTFTDNILPNDNNEGQLEIINSDMGKAIFMNCDFTKFKVIFLSSKIIEIFLANTSFPPIADENYRTFAGIYDYEQKMLCYTQLKKIFDSRGDSLNCTKFHKAELEVWENELLRQENEEKGPSINNHKWLKKLKLKIFNWISIKLFPKYWMLSIKNLELKKLIYSQYKKMYEGRGDAVKAIEYQGKELDVHRTILYKAGGQYWERFQLSLNKYSNNFGQSWQWAIICIIVSGLIFYSCYCLSLGFYLGNSTSEDKQRFWTLSSYFFEFINPIRKGEFIKLEDSDYVKVTGWARVIDFFWRIVITYLGYQLIQAFRKYSKKTS